MPREKSRRKLNFKPIFKEFIPKNSTPLGIVELLHEEIEAIYLMDVMGLYQEDAAKKMEVSRPTFTRIVKNARQKIAKALISGYTIKIDDIKSEVLIAICSNTLNEYEKITPNQEFLHILKFENGTLRLEKTMINPIYEKKLKPASILPSVLLEHNINIFISSTIGEGLKNSLVARGIRPLGISELESLESLENILIKKL